MRPDLDDRPVLLALRALKLGDLLVAVPALKAVRRNRPAHRIVLAAPGWLAPIAALTGAIDELLPTAGLDESLAVSAGSVETALNLHGAGPESRALLDELRPRTRLGHASPAAAEPIWVGPRWLDGIHERERWARLVSWHGMSADASDVSLLTPDEPPSVAGAVAVHVGAFYGSRHWPVERFAAVARALADEGERVVITGGEADRPRAIRTAELAGLPRPTVLAGDLTLGAFAALIAAARLVVTVDTGAAHLASAYRTPSVVLFGPAPAEEWGPPPGPHVVLTDAAVRRGDAFAPVPDPALLAVSAADALAAARGLL